MLVASTAVPGTERLGRRRGEEATAEDIATSAGTGEELEQGLLEADGVVVGDGPRVKARVTESLNS
jgi:hypothetical protein